MLSASSVLHRFVRRPGVIISSSTPPPPFPPLRWHSEIYFVCPFTSDELSVEEAQRRLMRECRGMAPSASMPHFSWFQPLQCRHGLLLVRWWRCQLVHPARTDSDSFPPAGDLWHGKAEGSWCAWHQAAWVSALSGPVMLYHTAGWTA